MVLEGCEEALGRKDESYIDLHSKHSQLQHGFSVLQSKNVQVCLQTRILSCLKSSVYIPAF